MHGQAFKKIDQSRNVFNCYSLPSLHTKVFQADFQIDLKVNQNKFQSGKKI